MQKVGYAFLTETLGLPGQAPAVALVGPVSRVEVMEGRLVVPSGVAPETDRLLDHVLFALKHEGTNLQVLAQVLPRVDAGELSEELRAHPASQYRRLAGYLWEALSGRALDDLPALTGKTVPVYDPDRFVTAPGKRDPKWRVEFNGLGTLDYCAEVRRTPAIQACLNSKLADRVSEFVESTSDKALLDRAVGWAYLGETRASFEIEREAPSGDKARAFAELLRRAHDGTQLSEEYLARLQSAVIRNPVERAVTFRHKQNWLESSTRGPLGVTYVPPPPEEVPGLMAALMEFANGRARAVDPVTAASCISFGFVFVHPFMDGNGRLSRFLFHHTLCQSGMLANGLILPVSIAMLRNEDAYLRALQSYSRPLRDAWDVTMLDADTYSLDFKGHNALLRYWDATACVEFGYAMAEQALEHELGDQVRFMRRFDRIDREVNARFDLPNPTRKTLIVAFLEHGRISKRRRAQFANEIPENVMDEIEAVCGRALAEGEEDEMPPVPPLHVPSLR